jgi:hypothetical protein
VNPITGILTVPEVGHKLVYHKQCISGGTNHGPHHAHDKRPYCCQDHHTCHLLVGSKRRCELEGRSTALHFMPRDRLGRSATSKERLGGVEAGDKQKPVSGVPRLISTLQAFAGRSASDQEFSGS